MIAKHDSVVGVELDRARGLDHPRRIDGFAHHFVQRDRLALERTALVESREQEPSHIDARLSIPARGTASWEVWGQDMPSIPEVFVDQVDVVLPMDYPSHFAPGTYGLGNPNAHPYATLEHALRDAKARSAGHTQ